MESAVDAAVLAAARLGLTFPAMVFAFVWLVKRTVGYALQVVMPAGRQGTSR